MEEITSPLRLKASSVVVSPHVLGWLLEEDEPSVRASTLVEVLGEDEREDSVEKTKEHIGARGWAAGIFHRQKEHTYWDNPDSCYLPKWSSCIWQLMVLADLGVSGDDPRTRNSVDHFLNLHNVETGGISLRPRGSEKFEPHVCATGNMVRALTRFGYYSDDRVVKALDWLVSQQLADGGWNCFAIWGGRHGSFKATIEPLWALAEILPRNSREAWRESAKKGSEFLLQHRIFKSDRDDSVVLLEFMSSHYPIHYKYDFLHALRVLTSLGTMEDTRLNDAVNLLLEKRLPDGRWPLDAVYRGWRTPRPQHGAGAYRPEEDEVITYGWGSGRTFQLEEAGKPSKWITLQALLALKRLGLVAPVVSKMAN